LWKISDITILTDRTAAGNDQLKQALNFKVLFFNIKKIGIKWEITIMGWEYN
jgi:hypothetical protein